jgi:uncharacterized protein YyaL (SSP411 family)
MKKLNRLSEASSPYLRQHAENPVDWYEWGEEALTKAKTENKPLLISVGYAACHWCHVMAHESFSDEVIAEFMNTHFVCIKVDREERPDIDRIYMDAAHLVSGRGGWPLNAFALPDGRPYYAATYFPPNQWMDALNQLSDVFKSDYERALRASEALTAGIQADNLPEITEQKAFSREEYDKAFSHHVETVDFDLGGYARAPKFMMPVGWEFFLQYHSQTGNPLALDAATIALDAIARGGINDQIGGGFARYSTDEFWKVPHFEKMLYDNGQLISLYAKAYQLTKKPLYAEVVAQTIAFAERELLDISGGFYASIDADSEHEEGKFYVRTKNEFDAALSPETALLIGRFYQVSDYGNWEHGKNILHYTTDKSTFAEENGLTLEAFETILTQANETLLAVREKRIRPTTDDKILTSWNALMLSGYVDAFKATGEGNYRIGALRTANFIDQKMLSENGLLYRVYKDGKVTIEAFLEDYSLLAQAFIGLYEITFDLKWLTKSRLLTEYVWIHFLDSERNLFFYTSDQAENLIARKHELSDNVIPASNSVMAHVLHQLGQYFEEQKYTEMVEKMLSQVRKDAIQQGSYYANWARLIGKLTYPAIEVAVLGENALPLALELQQKYYPNAIFAGGTEENLPVLKDRLVEGKTLIYVCENKACNLPVETVDEAKILLTQRI